MQKCWKKTSLCNLNAKWFPAVTSGKFKEDPRSFSATNRFNQSRGGFLQQMTSYKLGALFYRKICDQFLQQGLRGYCKKFGPIRNRRGGSAHLLTNRKPVRFLQQMTSEKVGKIFYRNVVDQFLQQSLGREQTWCTILTSPYWRHHSLHHIWANNEDIFLFFISR